MRPRAAIAPSAEHFIFGPVAQWDVRRQTRLAEASAYVGGTARWVRGCYVVASLPVAALDGINRWRWVASALARPEVIGTESWADAAREWAPSLEGGTVRVITHERFKNLTGA